MLAVLEGSSLVYPLWGLFLVVISLWVVPRRDYRYLLPHGVLGGLWAAMVITVFDKVLGAFIYVQAFPYAVMNTPVFIVLAWGAVIIIFLWSLPQGGPPGLQGAYVSLFVIASIVPETMFHQLGVRPYAPWFASWMSVFHVSLIFVPNYLIFKWRYHLDPPTK